MKSIFKIIFILILTNSFLQAMEKIEISINDKKLIAEVAKTQEEKNLGLMNRSSLGENEGMLFVFEKPRRVGFWMKDTSIPLDIAYLNAEGVILEIYHLIPYSRSSVQSKSDQICYALEVNKDWFSKNGFKIGEKIKF
jgi:uncharacterized membrane protein (UPF0127 family)